MSWITLDAGVPPHLHHLQMLAEQSQKVQNMLSLQAEDARCSVPLSCGHRTQEQRDCSLEWQLLLHPHSLAAGHPQKLQQ